MREIALDTETTGLSYNNGDRIIEIGCVEIIDKQITGNTFHVYINPNRDVSEESFRITGLSNEFLRKQKPFSESVDAFLDFVKKDRLVIHNAAFDMGFLNHELSLLNAGSLKENPVIDTLYLAKEKFPGASATLDALCRRFSVNASSRIKHGALIDAQLLAEVYLHLSVEVLQKDIFGSANAPRVEEQFTESRIEIPSREFLIPEEERLAHQEFLTKLKNPIWLKILETES